MTNTEPQATLVSPARMAALLEEEGIDPRSNCAWNVLHGKLELEHAGKVYRVDLDDAAQLAAADARRTEGTLMDKAAAALLAERDRK